MQPVQHPPWRSQQQFAPPVAFQPSATGRFASDDNPRLARRAFTMGLIAFLTAWIPFLGMFAMIPGIWGAQVGIAATIQKLAGRGLAITGAILGILGTLAALANPIVGIVFLVGALTQASG